MKSILDFEREKQNYQKDYESTKINVPKLQENKSIGSTLLDIGSDILVGAAKTGKGIALATQPFFEAIGADETAANLQYLREGGLEKSEQAVENKYFDGKSYIKQGGTLDGIAEGIGQMAFYVAGGKLAGGNAALATAKAKNATSLLGKVGNFAKTAISNPTTQIMFTSGVANGYLDAESQGATQLEALTYGLLSGTKEVAIENIAGMGIGKIFGKGVADDFVEKFITDNIKSQVGQQIAKYGTSVVGEGLEEVASGLLEPFTQAVYKKELDFSSYKTLWDSFIQGAGVSAILGVPVAVKGYSVETQKQKNTDKLVENLERIGKMPLSVETQVKLNAEIEGLKDGSIDVNEYIPKYTQVWQPMEQNNAVQQQTTQDSVNTPQTQNVETDYLNRSQTDNALVNQFRQNATDQGVQLDKGFVDSIEKIITDRNVGVNFDNALAEGVNGQIQTVNGQTQITINPNSQRAGEFVIMHELSHSLETDTMKQLVTDYASKQPGFNEALESLKKTYNTTEVSDEVLADISGQLFGNQEFINNLSTQQPSTFKKIYDAIISFANKVTGNSNQTLFIKDLKNKWESAYRNQNNQIKGTKYSKNYANNIFKDANIYSNDIVLENLDNKQIGVDFLKRLNEFSKKHPMENTTSNNISSGIYVLDDNLFKLTTIEENGKLFIEELYIENQGQGTGTKVVNELKKYAKENNLSIETHKELESAKDFWDKTLNRTQNNQIEGTKLSQQEKSLDSNIDYNKPTPDGYITLYHNTKGESVENISKEGLKINQNESGYKASPEEGSVVWAVSNKNSRGYGGNTVAFTIPVTDVQKVNDNEYTIGRDILPSEIDFIDRYIDNNTKESDIPRLVEEMGYDKIYNTLERRIGKEKTDIAFKKNNLLKSSTEQVVDNQGNTLSKQQQEHHKDSKVRDEDGNLMVVYRGDSGSEINVFDRKFSKSSNLFGRGFYFSTRLEKALQYGNVKKYYLNIKNPLNAVNPTNNITKEKLMPFLESIAANEDYSIENYGDVSIEKLADDLLSKENDYLLFNDLSTTAIGDFVETIELYNKINSTDIDGIILIDEIVAFNSNQIKNIDNTNPTTNEDVRYSKTDGKWQEFVESNFKATGTRTNMLPKAQEITDSSTELILPTPQESINEEFYRVPQTSKLPQGSGVGTSSFKSNIQNSEAVSKPMKDLDFNSEYVKLTNEQVMEEAKNRLDANLSEESLRLMQIDPQRANAADVAGLIQLMGTYDSKGMTSEWKQTVDKLREIGTISGQNVQAFSILSRMTPEGMKYYVQKELGSMQEQLSKSKSKAWVDKHKGDFELTDTELKQIEDAMNRVQKTTDERTQKIEIAKIQKMINDKLPTNAGKSVKAFRRLSMLMNFKTQVRNIVSNAAIMPKNLIDDFIGVNIDKQLSKKTGTRTTGIPGISNYLEGTSKALGEAVQDYKLGIDTSNISARRWEIGRGNSFSNKTPIGRALNKLDRLNNFGLRVGDAAFSGAEFNNALKNMMKLNNVTEPTIEMIELAEQIALQRTWQDDNAYTRAVIGIRNAMNTANIGGFGLGDIIIPFAKTPANITKGIVDNSPLGLVKALTLDAKNFKNKLDNGTNTIADQRNLVNNISKGVTGTMLYFIAFALRDVLSGGAEEDKDLNNFMRNTLGIQPYSVQIGGTTYTYDWLQPLTTPFAIVADSKSIEGEDTLDTIMSSMSTAGERIMEQSFVQGISDLFSNYSDNGFEGVLKGFFEDLPSSFIPTAVNQVRQLTDSYSRMTYESDLFSRVVNSVTNKLPGISKEMPVRYDTFGQEIENFGGENNLFNVFFNPANVSIAKDNTIAEEILRIYEVTGDKTIFPRVAPTGITYQDEKINLNTEQQSQFQKVSGDVVSLELEKMFNDGDYLALSTEEQGELVNDVVGYAYNKAREEVVGLPMSDTYNKINEYISQGGQVSDYYIRKEEVDYSLDNPTNYNLMNSISTYDEYNYAKSELDEIRKNYSTTDEKKYATYNYINTLNIGNAEKALMFKNYYSSYDDYNVEIIEHLQKQNLTQQEQIDVLEKLGFTVEGGYIKW